MERYNNRKIDETGKIVLHSTLREVLKLDKGSKITLSHIGSLVVVGCGEGDGTTCTVDELGRFELPSEVRKEFGWTTGSEVAVYHTGTQLVLKTA